VITQPNEPAPVVADRPKCWRCGNRNLALVYEMPHPLFGVLGVTLRTLRCTDQTCGKFTVD
jgi:hypothetical protein